MKKHWLLNSGHILLRETRPQLSTVSTHISHLKIDLGKNLMKIKFIHEQIKFEHKKLAGISVRKGNLPSAFWQVMVSASYLELFWAKPVKKKHLISWLTLHAAQRSALPDDPSRLAARENGLPLLIRIYFGKTEALK